MGCHVIMSNIASEWMKNENYCSILLLFEDIVNFTHLFLETSFPKYFYEFFRGIHPIEARQLNRYYLTRKLEILELFLIRGYTTKAYK